MSGITGSGVTGGGGGAPSNEDYLTSSSETATLPNSRNLLAGTNVAFDDTVANQRTVNVSGSSGADPTASLGLTAVNGVATTFLRSDGAPALSQSIAPTWSGAHTFTNAVPITVSSAEPRVLFNETDQAANEKLWDEDVSAKIYALRTRTDADGAGVNILAVTRGTGTAITNMALGNATNNPTFTWLGSGTSTFGGAIVSSSGQSNLTRLGLTSALVPTGAGINQSGTNRLGFCTNTTLRGEFDENGNFLIENTTPALILNETDVGADLKSWQLNAAASVLTLSTVTDALGTGKNILTATRGATTAISGISFGNATDNPTFTWLGTGLGSFGGALGITGTLTAHSGAVIASAGNPRFRFNETDAGTDLKIWQWAVDSAVAKFVTMTDAAGAGKDAISITRGATTAISDISLGNATDNPTFNWLGTGAGVFGGVLSSGAFTSTGAILSNSTNPSHRWRESDQGTDLKYWIADADAGVWKLRTATDAIATGKDIISVTRGATTAISNISLGNATDSITYTFPSAGAATFSGGVLAARFNPTAATVPGAGFYLPAANTLGFATATTLRLSIDTAAITSTLPLLAADGTAGAPSYSFTNDTDTGFGLITAGQLGVSVAGTYRFQFEAGTIRGAGAGGTTVNLVGGDGGGAVNVTGGVPDSGNAGGAATIQGGTGVGAGGNGGAVTARGGTAADGNGGAASLIGRDGVGTNRNGGNVTITAGAATGAGTAGIITFNGPFTFGATVGATTGAQTATFVATNKPGAGTGAPTIWFPFVVSGTTYWVPGFAN